MNLSGDIRMARKGWHREPGRHSLAARGLRTSHVARHVPMKSTKHGPRPATVAKWIENWFENYRLEQIDKERKIMKEVGIPFEEPDGGRHSTWNEGSFMVSVDTGKSDNGLDYVEVRTDSSAYELFYNPGTSDMPRMGYKAQEELYRALDAKFPSLYFEHEGGGVLRAYLWNYNPSRPRYSKEDEEEGQRQEQKMIDAQEAQIMKYETDYTGEYTRGH